jgi:hypothetical protein
VLFFPVSTAVEHLTSLASKENGQPEYSELPGHAVPFLKLLFHLPPLHIALRFVGGL